MQLMIKNIGLKLVPVLANCVDWVSDWDQIESLDIGKGSQGLTRHKLAPNQRLAVSTTSINFIIIPLMHRSI